MEHFDVVAKNMAGVVRTAREAIVSMSLFDPRYLDDVLDHVDAWSRWPDAALWFSVSWAEGTRP